MAITIQEATSADWSAVADVTQIANQQYAATADPNFWVHYESSTRQLLLNEAGIVRFGAYENGELIASVIYCPPYEKEMAGTIVRNPYPEMRLLSVLPQHRNRGLAARLIDECELRARNENQKAITLHTTILMSVAKAMYERRGYARFPQIDFEPKAGFVVWGYIKNLED